MSTPSLVTTAWLATEMGRPDLQVLDGTYFLPAMKRDGHAEFKAGHIPGAAFFDIDAIADKSSPLPHMLPTPEQFEAAVGDLGVGNETQVVVYDTFGLMSAARVWWMFRVFGHSRVAVLDGGLPKWIAEGRPLATGDAAPPAKQFKATFQPHLVRSSDQVLANIGAGAEQVVDARAAGRFEGSEAEIWPGRRAGHIPGSRNLPFTDLLDPGTKTVRSRQDIAARVRDAGLDPTRPVVASCGSGVTACVVALGLDLIGAPQVAVYDGSWAEWGLPSSNLPVETGPAQPSA
ncbi:MAG TPA: 3-mercaptopyruvate sulfurtransferase [Azospirillaceae bacterium]|nr:3-mercaptopyruvate sulfurtransferase [Azospirillaceae bacterium]